MRASVAVESNSNSHLVQPDFSNRSQLVLRCRCGWIRFIDRRNGRDPTAEITRAIARHLQTAEAMTRMRAAMKPPTKAENI